MIKQTLYFGNPAYLNLKNKQLVINLPDAKGIDNQTGMNTFPVEDLGVLMLDNPQITLTHALMQALIENNVAVITCDKSHMPSALFMPLEGNVLQHERFRNQINASKVLNKQLWQQTVKMKIYNQAANLLAQGHKIQNMKHWAKEVQTDDAVNHEGRAAANYWPKLFPQIPDFRRDREGDPPNNLLNYGYAILRSIAARALVGSGLLPTLGIHHDNKYNAYCLADDIMEPYRPYVDWLIWKIVQTGEDFTELSKSIKAQMLSIPTLDVVINGKKSPLMVAMQQTTASLYRVFDGKQRKILYPVMNEILQIG